MISDKLAMKVADKLRPISGVTCNLNFKLEGESADKLELIAKELKISKTEAAKFIIKNSLDDLITHIETIKAHDTNEHTEPSKLDETIIRIAKPKISALASGKEFELKELIGNSWEQFGEHGDKNRAGKRFKKLVESGHFPDVKHLKTKSNNHALYKKI